MIKKLLNNKIVRYAAMGLASFLVINVGMFFFLRATQPKMGARAETAKVADSTAHMNTTATHLAEIKPDSTAVPSLQTPDTAKTLAATTIPDTAMPSPVTASLATPVEPAMPPPPEPEQSVSSVDSTPVASAPDTTADQAAAVPGKAVNDGKELSKLAKLLESVKPDEAAAIASQLEIDQIVDLVMKMKDRSAGRMLAAMSPEQAARVAVRMSRTAEQTRKKL